ncbi:hypothetical protein F4779DRAFT_588304 [Xylariaceae sp. FL0662B]|nr:hypothetical protein F4779DRAFT_588304 [Xylariaceae sp. FL0662B]
MSHEQYLGDFWATKTKIQKASNKPTLREPPSATRAWFCDKTQEAFLKLTDLARLERPGITRDAAVIVVENVSLDWIATLGTIFNIDVEFFCEYVSTPEGSSPWKAVFDPSGSDIKRPMRLCHIPEPANNLDHRHNSAHPTMESHHIDGVFELGQPDQLRSSPYFIGNNFIHRRVENHAPFGWEASTRISYCRVQENLYLFLVDAPVMTSPVDDESILLGRLHFPVSKSRGGLVLPSLFNSTQHSLFESLQQFFSHSWHFDILGRRGVSANTILYFLVASTWAANLRYVDRDIKRVAFKDIRRPNIYINDRLHEYREKLAVLRAEVSSAKKWMPELVRGELEEIQNLYCSIGFPDRSFDEVLAEADTAERFLMDTFQLLISSISVLDSETGIQQARSGQKLAQLASIYIPFSLVTGIFGMNIREINGSPLPVWVCLVALLISVGCTIGIFSLLNKGEVEFKRKRKKKI